MLGFIYVMLTAKPISIRRLGLLFMLSWVLARTALEVLHPGQAAHFALVFSISLTLFVWILPLARVAYATVRSARISLNALEPVSLGVQITYGLALGILPIVAVEIPAQAAHQVSAAFLVRALIAAGTGATVLVLIHILSVANSCKKQFVQNPPRHY